MSLAEDILKDVRMVLDQPCPDLDGTIIALQKAILRPIFPELEPAIKRLRGIIRDPAFLDEDFDKAMSSVIAHVKSAALSDGVGNSPEAVLRRIDIFLNDLYNEKSPPSVDDRVTILNQFKEYIQLLINQVDEPMGVRDLLTDFIAFLRRIKDYATVDYVIGDEIRKKIASYEDALRPYLVESISMKDLAKEIIDYGVFQMWDTGRPLPFEEITTNRVSGWDIACALISRSTMGHVKIGVEPLATSDQKYLVNRDHFKVEFPGIGKWEIYKINS